MRVGLAVWDSNPGTGRYFSLCHRVQTSSSSQSASNPTNKMLTLPRTSSRDVKLILKPSYCRDYVCAEIHLHSPIRVYIVVLN